MAKHKLGKTHQKLYFARFFLEAIEKAGEEAPQLNQKALLAAYQEACLFQLVSAYQGLVWEIAHTCDLEYVPNQPLQSLIQTLETQGRGSSELNRLLELEQQPGCWLKAMLEKWSVLSDLNPESAVQAVQAPVENAIEMRVVTDTDEHAQLSDWYENLSKLIDEIRSLMLEW